MLKGSAMGYGKKGRKGSSKGSVRPLQPPESQRFNQSRLVLLRAVPCPELLGHLGCKNFQVLQADLSPEQELLGDLVLKAQQVYNVPRSAAAKSS